MGAIRLAAALLFAITATTAYELTAPVVTPDTVQQNARVLLKGFEAAITFDLTWDVPDGYNITEDMLLYYRLRRDTSIYTSGSTPARGNAWGMPLESLAILVKPPQEGFQPWQIDLALKPDFTDKTTTGYKTRVMYGGLTIMPPVLVVVLAILTRDVYISLFCGVWIGALIIHDYHPWNALLRTLDTYLVEAWADNSKISIILFTWFLAGLCANIYKNGGGYGLAEALSKYAKTRTSTQLLIFGLGWAIFYDDYSNSLIIGNTMRSVADSMYVSREKFSYLVDSGSAPIASIAPISSWVGFELSQIRVGYESIRTLYGDAAADLYDQNVYTVFLKSIVSRYYPWFVLCLQFVLILTNREFGPMLQAERRALYEKKLWADNARIEEITVDSKLEPEPDTPRRWWNAVLPIIGVICGVFIGLILSGYYVVKADGGKATAEALFSNGDSFRALLWGTFIVVIAVWVLGVLQWKDGSGKIVRPNLRQIFKTDFKPGEPRPIMTFQESMASFIRGVEQLTATIFVLILAWAIALVMDRVGTGRYIADGLSGSIDAKAIPVLTFILCAIISFATGTSWGTMAIMFPIAIPTIHLAAQGSNRLMLLTISSILAGAIFGDHCTLISDTTILSALACRCDLRHHVKTQMPYAIFAACCSVLVGYIPAGYNAGPGYMWLLLGMFATSVFAWLLAAPVDRPESSDFISAVHEKYLQRGTSRKAAGAPESIPVTGISKREDA